MPGRWSGSTVADYPGCDCGHPHAEPSWIDHSPGCPWEQAQPPAQISGAEEAPQHYPQHRGEA